MSSCKMLSAANIYWGCKPKGGGGGVVAKSKLI